MDRTLSSRWFAARLPVRLIGSALLSTLLATLIAACGQPPPPDEDVVRTLRAMTGEIAAIIMEEAFDDLDGPVARVCGADVPIPYAKALEQAALPNPQQIADAALALF